MTRPSAHSATILLSVLLPIHFGDGSDLSAAQGIQGIDQIYGNGVQLHGISKFKLYLLYVHFSVTNSFLCYAQGIENGFVSDGNSGSRAVIVYVVFRSTINPEISMICEVRLTLHQITYEERRLCEVRQIMMDETFYAMVVGAEEEGTKQGMDLKMLEFERILNVKTAVDFKNSIKVCISMASNSNCIQMQFCMFVAEQDYYKCAVQPDIMVLSMNIMGYDAF